MGGYGRNWGDALAGGLTALAVAAVALVAIAVATFFLCLCTEVARVYASRAIKKTTRTARILWILLAAFLGVLLVAAALGSAPATAGFGALLAGWGFLAWVVGVEGCDLYEQRFDQPPMEPSIEAVLEPWDKTYAPPVASGNGAYREPIGSVH